MFTIQKGQPQDYYALQLMFLKCVAVDFKENSTNMVYKIYSIFVLAIIFGYPVFQGCDIFRFFHETAIFSVVLLYNNVYWICAAKIAVFLYNRKYIYKILTSFERGVFVPISDVESSMIKKYIRLANILSVMYLFPTTSSFITGVSDSIASRLESDDSHHWKFPMGHFGAFNVTYSPNYEIAVTIQASCSLISSIATMVSDTLIVSSLLHIMVQFKVLQYRIKTVLIRADALMNEENTQEAVIPTVIDPSKIPWKYLKVALSECIFYHTEILDLSEKLENTFTYVYLLQFLISSVSICFTIYSCSLFPVNDARFLHYLQATLVLSIQVFYFCYWGNEVTLNSLAVAEACREVDYVGTDVRFQKGLVLIIERSQRPVVFTAGKFATLSLDTFVAIIRASYSYYTVMSSR